MGKGFGKPIAQKQQKRKQNKQIDTVKLLKSMDRIAEQESVRLIQDIAYWKHLCEAAAWDGLEKELAGIIRWNQEGVYPAARRLLYSALLPLKNFNHVTTDEEAQQIRQAGEMLYEAEGMAGLHDSLLWMFIPKSVHGIVEQIWDGVGEWKA